MSIRRLAGILAATLLGACAHIVAERSPTAGPARIEAPHTAVGQSWSYRLMNGYNGEFVRQYREQVVEGPGPSLQLVRTDPARGESLTEVYTPTWNWVNKARPGFSVLEYSPPLAALPFPLEVGRSWSHRSVSVDPQTGERYPVRVDGKVIGWEKIKVPAGVFDALLVRRLVYIGDGDYEKSDTQIVESDWYAPAVGRVVRSENTSGHFDLLHSSPPFGRTWVRGDWNVLELAEAPGTLAR